MRENRRDNRNNYLDDSRYGTGKEYFSDNGIKKYGYCRYGEHWVERDDMISISIQVYVGVGGNDYERIAGKVCKECRDDAVREVRDMLGWNPRLMTASQLAREGVEGFQEDDSEAALRSEGRDFTHPVVEENM